MVWSRDHTLRTTGLDENIHSIRAGVFSKIRILAQSLDLEKSRRFGWWSF